jgi:hypothetical protein
MNLLISAGENENQSGAAQERFAIASPRSQAPQFTLGEKRSRPL